MDWQRLAVMVLVEVMQELTRRLGMNDLSEKCSECKNEIQAATSESQKEG